MGVIRAHVVLPDALAREIDTLVGPRGRSAFLVETATKEIKRRKLLAFLNREEPAWRDEDHPDIAQMGSAEWVRALRNEPSARLIDRNQELDPE